MPKTSVDINLPIEFSEVCEVLWGSPSTSGKRLFGNGTPATDAFARAIEQGGTFNATYVGTKDRLTNFRGYNSNQSVTSVLKYPTIVYSSIDWTNPNNTLNAPNGTVGSVIIPTAQEYGITLHGFGFNIPTNATIKGFRFSPKARTTIFDSNLYISLVEMFVSTAGFGTNTKWTLWEGSIYLTQTLTTYEISDGTTNIGNPSPFVYSDFNTNNLKVTLYFTNNSASSKTFELDSLGLEVFYTIPSSATAPTAPVLSVGTITSTSVALSWTAPATADAYTIWRKPTSSGTYSPIGLGNVTSYTVSGLTASTSYDFYVVATNAYGSSPNSNVITQSTSTPQTDTTPPSIPTGLTGQGLGLEVRLTWNPSTDNVGVTGYNIYRDGSFRGTSATTEFYDSTNINTNYTYTVRAYDAANNVSGFSNSITVYSGGGT